MMVQVALLLRVHSLWDNRKEIKYALIIGFIACYGASVSFVLVTMIQFSGKTQSFPYIICSSSDEGRLQYSEVLQSCILPGRPQYLAGTWGAMV